MSRSNYHAKGEGVRSTVLCSVLQYGCLRWRAYQSFRVIRTKIDHRVKYSALVDKISILPWNGMEIDAVPNHQRCHIISTKHKNLLRMLLELSKQSIISGFRPLCDVEVLLTWLPLNLLFLVFSLFLLGWSGAQNLAEIISPQALPFSLLSNGLGWPKVRLCQERSRFEKC